jgi:hypothetical protein
MQSPLARVVARVVRLYACLCTSARHSSRAQFVGHGVVRLLVRHSSQEHCERHHRSPPLGSRPCAISPRLASRWPVDWFRLRACRRTPFGRCWQHSSQPPCQRKRDARRASDRRRNAQQRRHLGVPPARRHPNTNRRKVFMAGSRIRTWPAPTPKPQKPGA